MAKLADYHEFAGRHDETGTVRNALVYQQVKAPHTGEPLSEALLLGISGGITVGYFTFEYQGYRPHLALLTRNTFDPLETLFERLAIPREVLQTTDPNKGEANLREALEGGRPAIVWADRFTLPYNHLPCDERNWAMRPLLVYGLDDGSAYLADRANGPIIIPAELLQKARGRVSKDRYRVMTLDAPDLCRLPAAVSKGIWQCISLYTDAPPKGKRDNFGLAALQYWATMLTNTRNKHSWARYFPPGERLWMALAGDLVQPGAYSWVQHEAGNSAERGRYADFLDEAAVILGKSGLNEAAGLFRHSEAAWHTLEGRLLPASVPLLNEAAELLTRKRRLFLEQGAEVADAIQQVNARLTALREEVSSHFPLVETEVVAFRAGLAQQVQAIYDLERDAVRCLQSVMA
jgi:hypothetical protein